jgi:hypothetical protein
MGYKGPEPKTMSLWGHRQLPGACEMLIQNFVLSICLHFLCYLYACLSPWLLNFQERNLELFTGISPLIPGLANTYTFNEFLKYTLVAFRLVTKIIKLNLCSLKQFFTFNHCPASCPLWHAWMVPWGIGMNSQGQTLLCFAAVPHSLVRIGMVTKTGLWSWSSDDSVLPGKDLCLTSECMWTLSKIIESSFLYCVPGSKEVHPTQDIQEGVTILIFLSLKISPENSQC